MRMAVGVDGGRLESQDIGSVGENFLPNSQQHLDAYREPYGELTKASYRRQVMLASGDDHDKQALMLFDHCDDLGNS